MANKLDLNKIKNEIDSRKREKNMVSSQLGESVGVGVAPRDEFLHGLITSLNSGKTTPSSNLIKIVENKVSSKHGEVKSHVITETEVVPETHKKIEMSPERDEQLYADLEKKRNQTLAESISTFNGTQPTTPTSSIVDYNGKQMLTSLPQNAVNPTQNVQINEGTLVESVRQIVNGHLSENLGIILEESIKNAVIEMYAVERIKEVLNENRDLIRSVVIETIKDIQAKTKARQNTQS